MLRSEPLRCWLPFLLYWRVKNCLATQPGLCPPVNLVIFHGQSWEHGDRELVCSHWLSWASDPLKATALSLKDEKSWPDFILSLSFFNLKGKGQCLSIKIGKQWPWEYGAVGVGRAGECLSGPPGLLGHPGWSRERGPCGREMQLCPPLRNTAA